MGKTPKEKNAKAKDLAAFQDTADKQYLTTNHGLRVNDDQNTLKAGERGPSLLEDFIFARKSPTLITSVSPSAWCMHEEPRRTDSSKCTNLWHP